MTIKNLTHSLEESTLSPGWVNKGGIGTPEMEDIVPSAVRACLNNFNNFLIGPTPSSLALQNNSHNKLPMYLFLFIYSKIYSLWYPVPHVLINAFSVTTPSS